MAVKDFVSKDGASKFVNSGRVLINGRPGRMWALYKYGKKAWHFHRTAHLPLRATRLQIESSFEK